MSEACRPKSCPYVTDRWPIPVPVELERPNGKPAVDRPLAPEMLARARELGPRYRVVAGLEDGERVGQGVGVPGGGDDGPAADASMASTVGPLVVAPASVIEEGAVVLTPSTKVEAAALPDANGRAAVSPRAGRSTRALFHSNG